MTIRHFDPGRTGDAPVRILAVPGSLRAASRNRGLLRAAAEEAPRGVRIEIFHLRDIPPYDGDVEAQGYPESVRRLHDAIRRADALLIATPEYNGSIPGVLKNAIDWASRPRSDCALRDKPAALMGASPGRSRTANAQADLRRVLGATGSPVLDGPAVMMAGSAGEFDEEGTVTDEHVRDQVRAVVEALAAWVRPVPASVALEHSVA